MGLNGDNADVRRRVSAERDAYVAGRDIIIGSRPHTRTRADEDTLATLALKQAQEKRARLIGTDRPGDDTANVGYARVVPGRLREADGREIGDLRSVLEYYKSLSPQRLVVLGAPGTGKTVLLLELQIRLLEERDLHPETPVPILVTASAYDTAKSWEDWLAGQISLEFNIGKRRAWALVSGGRILPLVDGLDEMDPAGDSSPDRAQALVRALNESMQGLRLAPVVASCRPGEYGRLTEGIDKARHAELWSLTGPEAAAYLRGQFRDAHEFARWAPVLQTLEQDPNGPLTAELATPWKLTLALTVFRSGGDPAQLLSPPGITGSDYSAHVEGLLLNGYVPAAVSLHQKGTRYTYSKVQHWLADLSGGLAVQARNGRSATDITLHDWRRVEGRMGQISYAAAVVILSLALSAAVPAVTLAVLTAVFGLSASGAFSPRAHGSQQTFNRGKPVTRLGSGLANGLVFGIAIGLTAGLLAWSSNDHSSAPGTLASAALALGISGGLAAGLISGFTCKLANGLTGLVVGLVAGLVPGLIIGFAVGFENSLSAGLADGLAFGLWTGFLAGFVADLANRLTNFSPKSRGPHAIIRANGLLGPVGGLVSGLVSGLVLGLGGGLAHAFSGPGGLSAGLASGLTRGLSIELAAGLATGLATGLAVWFAICARIWIRYHCSTVWNALLGRSPLRFGRFLDWAVDAGLLREAGISYQFRHRQLQDWLTPGSMASGRGGARD